MEDNGYKTEAISLIKEVVIKLSNVKFESKFVSTDKSVSFGNLDKIPAIKIKLEENLFTFFLFEKTLVVECDGKYYAKYISAYLKICPPIVHYTFVNLKGKTKDEYHFSGCVDHLYETGCIEFASEDYKRIIENIPYKKN